ncbi:MAG: GNAT family acetyltransferase [Lachnospiraceae bacterium]|nr:GNAT family acetyltransferase [Lachnospiraceae bacterium]
MIRREDILPMGFLKKSDYSGSCGGLRYRLKKITEKFIDDSGEERESSSLMCEIWPGPFNYITTPAEVKESEKFSFDEDGVMDAVSWMNDKLAEDPAKWEKAASNWNSYQGV